MANDYDVYAERKNIKRRVLISNDHQNGNHTVIDADTGLLGCMGHSDFHKKYILVVCGTAPVDPQLIARKLLALPKISPAAIEQIERIIKMDTRGKSSVAIRDEVARLSAELPKGHVLRNVPKTYGDRAQAIAALTAIRQEIFQLKSSTTKKEVEIMAKKEAAVAAPAKPAAKPVAEKAAAKPAAKPVAEKAATKRPALAAAYKLTEKSEKCKTPEELRLHEGSTRYKLMAHMLTAKAARTAKGVPLAELQELLGDDTSIAIKSMSKTNYEFIVGV